MKMATINESVGKDGITVYRVRVRVKGRPIESRTFSRKTDAKNWGQEREVQLRRELGFGSVGSANKTLAELIDRYLDVEISKRNTNNKMVETCLAWWRVELGDRKLRNITPSILAECRDRLLQANHKQHQFGGKKSKKKSPATVTRYMAALSHAYTIAVNEWEWLDSNPMIKVKKPSLPQGRDRFLDEDERKDLLEACLVSSCAYLYPIVIIAISTGARRGEILNLRWRDVDLERGLARLVKTKNNEKRAIPITHIALETIQSLYREESPSKTDFLFPRADGQKPVEITKHWKKALVEAKIEDFRFHDLRHTAASYLAMNGATLAEIAEVLGHKTLQMVKRYAHLSDQHTARVVERMNRKIFSDEDGS